jgi:predicted  nucleic acid-binding Zn-ribbon protein
MATKTKNSKMEITNRDLLAISQGIAYINSKETKVWHTLAKNLDQISDIVTSVNERHKEITKKFAKVDDKGAPIRNSQNQIDFGANLENANKEWESIMDEKVTIELVPILLDDLKDYGLDANMMKPLMGKLVVE